MLKLFFGAAFIVVMCSCTTLSPTSKEFYRVAGKANDGIMKALTVRSGGSGEMIPDKILVYDGSFDYYKPMTIEEGRKFVLCASKIALDVFNSDNRIQKYLENIPFTVNNLMIFFFVDPIPGKISNQFEIYCACLVNGKLLYDYYDYDQKRYVTIFKETYEEALQRLQECEGDKSERRPV